jgi:hypothetical protein
VAALQERYFIIHAFSPTMSLLMSGGDFPRPGAAFVKTDAEVSDF